jgi:RHS repeat-associated protein
MKRHVCGMVRAFGRGPCRARFLIIGAFTYDHRGRLIEERRDGRNGYWLRYSYDQGGNRLLKEDVANQREVEYVYDLDDPGLYGSRANRLMKTTTRNMAAAGNPIISRTWYYYTAGANVRRVVTWDKPGDPQYYGGTGLEGEEPTIIYANDCQAQGLAEYKAVRFEYACNAATVTYAAGERWCGDPNNPAAPPVDAEVTWAREFRYDGARQRYMDRPLTPWSFQNNNVADTGDTVETRYDGNSAFLDFEMGSAVRAFEPGIGRIEPYDPGNWQNAMTDYYHADHLGTVRVITGPTGMALDLNGSSGGHDMVFTAFGEIVVGVSDGGSDRFGYVGAHGYQAHDEMPYLHLGARYYDPSTGRFLQRDPIGIRGGLNVYLYVNSVPTMGIDPTGLLDGNGGFDYPPPGYVKPPRPPRKPIPPPSTVGGPTGGQAATGAAANVVIVGGVIVTGGTSSAGQTLGSGMVTVGGGFLIRNSAIDFWTWVFYWPFAACATR